MATTYTNLNLTNDPIGMSVIDTTVATAPTERPSTFTPAGGYVPLGTGAPPSGDYSVGTKPTARAICFEPPSFTATIDLGLAVNG